MNALPTFPTLGQFRPQDSGFSPSNLSPDLWFDAADISTLFQESDFTDPVTTDGDAIGSIADKGSGDYSATQSEEDKKCEYVESYQNELPAIKFNGTDDYFVLDANLVLGDYIKISVCKTLGSEQFLVGGGDGTHLPHFAQGIQAYYNYSNQFSGVSTTGSGVLNIGEFGRESGVHTCFLNRVSLLDAPPDNSSIATIKAIGARSIDGTPDIISETHLCELLLFKRVLSEDEANLLYAYLNDKWAIY